MLVGVAFLPPSFPPSGTQAFYIIKWQNCLNICNTYLYLAKRYAALKVCTVILAHSYNLSVKMCLKRKIVHKKAGQQYIISLITNFHRNLELFHLSHIFENLEIRENACCDRASLQHVYLIKGISRVGLLYDFALLCSFIMYIAGL